MPALILPNLHTGLFKERFDMKILAVNGSPTKKKGMTNQPLTRGPVRGLTFINLGDYTIDRYSNGSTHEPVAPEPLAGVERLRR